MTAPTKIWSAGPARRKPATMRCACSRPSCGRQWPIPANCLVTSCPTPLNTMTAARRNSCGGCGGICTRTRPEQGRFHDREDFCVAGHIKVFAIMEWVLVGDDYGADGAAARHE